MNFSTVKASNNTRPFHSLKLLVFFLYQDNIPTIIILSTYSWALVVCYPNFVDIESTPILLFYFFL